MEIKKYIKKNGQGYEIALSTTRYNFSNVISISKTNSKVGGTYETFCKTAFDITPSLTAKHIVKEFLDSSSESFSEDYCNTIANTILVPCSDDIEDLLA